MSQSSYFKSRPDLVTLGGVWGGVGRSLRYVIHIIGKESLYWGGGVILKD